MKKVQASKPKKNSDKVSDWGSYSELNEFSESGRRVMTQVLREIGIAEGLDTDFDTLASMTRSLYQKHLLDVYSLTSGASNAVSNEVFRVQVFRTYKRLAADGYLKQFVYKDVKPVGLGSKKIKPQTYKIIRITPKGRVRLLLDTTHFSRDLSQAWDRLELLWKFYRVRSLRKDFLFDLSKEEQDKLLDHANPRWVLDCWLGDAQSYVEHYTLLGSLTSSQVTLVKRELIALLAQTPPYKSMGSGHPHSKDRIALMPGNPLAPVSEITCDLVYSIPGRLAEILKAELLSHALIRLWKVDDSADAVVKLRAELQYWSMAVELLKSFSTRLDELEKEIPAFLKAQKENLKWHEKIMKRMD